VLVAGMAFKDPSRDLDSAGITVYRRSGGQWTQEYQNIRVQTLGGYVGSFFSEIDEAGQHILFRPGSYRDPTEMLTHTASGWTSQLVQQPPSDLANGYGCASPRLSGDGQSIAWACTQLLRLDNKTLFVSRPPGWQLTESGRHSVPFRASQQSGRHRLLGQDHRRGQRGGDIPDRRPPEPGPRLQRHPEHDERLEYLRPDPRGRMEHVDGPRPLARISI
jgi:hypothetical protein